MPLKSATQVNEWQIWTEVRIEDWVKLGWTGMGS